ncbi:PDGF- and VEGF-related factor 1 isoform X2 [Ptiloglossa arizonensis]
MLIMVIGFLVAQSDTRFRNDTDSIVFPDQIEPWNGKPTRRANWHDGSNKVEMSMQLAKEIDSMDSIYDILKLVQNVPKAKLFQPLYGRIGDEGIGEGIVGEAIGEQRSNAERPVPAVCIPELQPVPLKLDTDPSTIYLPTCTRVKRCGGCCSHPLFSCQPVASKLRNFEVTVASLDDNGMLNFKNNQIVLVEEHTKCKCDCKIKAENCTEKQSYVEDDCRCECNNVDEASKCVNSKFWHPEHCACFCREELECSTGFYFDQNTCRCRQVPFSKSWFPPTKGADYKFGQTQKSDNVPPVIIALDATDPRRKPKEDPER